MPDFADLVSQGILSGFAGISPYMEKQQQLAMLREDRDYARLVSEEERGYRAQESSRQQEMFKQNLAASQQGMEFEAQMQPKRLGQADAAIGASKAQTRSANLSADVTQADLDRQGKYFADRKAVIDQMRGQIGDDKSLNVKLSSLAADTSIPTSQVHDLMEQEVRKRALPAMIALIKSGKVESIDPSFATILEAQYVTNGKIDLAEIGRYVYPKNISQRSLAMDLFKTAAEIKMQTDPENPYLGYADAINLWASFDATFKVLGDMSPSLIPGQDVAEPGAPVRGKGEPKRAITEGARPPQTEPALMSAGEAIRNGLNLFDVVKSGSRGQRVSGWNDQKVETFSVLKSLPADIQQRAAQQPEPFQLVTADALTNKPLGAFSAALASLSPGVGEGDPEDRIAGFITSDRGGVQGPDRAKIAQRAMQMVGLIEKPNNTYSRQAILQKASELYYKLRRNGDLGVTNKEESLVKLLIEWLKGPPGEVAGTQAGRGGDSLSKGRGIGPEPQP